MRTLRPGGHFLAKTFQGGTEQELLTLLKQNFASVHHVKPPASREGSVELYILAKGFKGRRPAPRRRRRTRRRPARIRRRGRSAEGWPLYSAGRRRPATSSPASRPIGTKARDAATVTTPTTKKATEKSAERRLARPEIAMPASSTAPASATPVATATCCSAPIIAVASPVEAFGTSAKASALIEVKNSERKKPPTSSSATTSAIGEPGR